MPIPARPNQINRPSMREEVYGTLLNWIMEGVLLPGEKLVDKSLAENLGVSRTPVREALRRLEDKALVQTEANRWTRVAPIAPAEAQLIYPVIWHLEELAVDMALPHLTTADFSDMRKSNRALDQAILDRDPVAASKADTRFHNRFVRRCGNPYLAEIIQDLKVKHRRLEVVFFKGGTAARTSVAEHEQIVAALKAGQADRARRLIRANWQASLDQLSVIPAHLKEN